MVAFNTSPLLFLLLFLTLILVSHALSASKFQCHKKDSDVLLKLKKSFNNPSLLSDWNKSTDCCEWSGIICDSDAKGRVTTLTIEYTDISGTISSSIGKLDKLRSLTIKGNTQLTGTIPSSIGKLKKLTIITITYNPFLIGPIPRSLCHLPRLDSLILFENNLTGQIPDCLGGKLTSINLSFNRLSGSIPASFLSKRSTNAPVLYFSVDRNNLTGVIPVSMGKIHFTQIDLSENRFTDASVLFGGKKKIKYMYLHHNRLAFNLTRVKFPLTLEVLTMDHNKLIGSIPQQITNLEKLTYLDVSYNKLCGSIPTGGSISKLSQDLFVHNKCLCGAPLKPCQSLS